MGNQLSAQPLKQSASPGDVLAEVPQVTYKATLGGGRFLKTVRCVHDDGGELVVKVTLFRSCSARLGRGFAFPLLGFGRRLGSTAVGRASGLWSGVGTSKA